MSQPDIDFQHIDIAHADDRGRITLGSEFANATVQVAWLELEYPEGPDDYIEPTQAEKDKYTELYQWAEENGYSMIEPDAREGRILTEKYEWVDADGVEGLAE